MKPPERSTLKAYASFITPVPGGIGPMTVAMCLANTIASARRTISVLLEPADSYE